MYVCRTYSYTYMYVHSYSICGKATYVATYVKSALAPFTDIKLQAYIYVVTYL